MLLNWLRQPSRNRNIETIYGVIVAQARQPVFYAEYGVPDTVAGRFDMIVLHLFLYINRMSGRGMDGVTGPPLFERFCADLDGNLREMGVGDLTVPKRMQKYAGAFYGRSAAYEKTVTARDPEATAAAIGRNVFGLEAPDAGARSLADYMFACVDALAVIEDAALERGQFAFPAAKAAAPAAAAEGDR
ncbi:MAG TPA: ubiquinol-cytochrome C chaperone family protein [Xanthobacteraceae bacterium]|nr:ubiquinol-cytochrome C chaperone family protein [Xanthobacteraceae bacterium]